MNSHLHSIQSLRFDPNGQNSEISKKISVKKEHQQQILKARTENIKKNYDIQLDNLYNDYFSKFELIKQQMQKEIQQEVLNNELSLENYIKELDDMKIRTNESNNTKQSIIKLNNSQISFKNEQKSESYSVNHISHQKQESYKQNDQLSTTYFTDNLCNNNLSSERSSLSKWQDQMLQTKRSKIASYTNKENNNATSFKQQNTPNRIPKPNYVIGAQSFLKKCNQVHQNNSYTDSIPVRNGVLTQDIIKKRHNNNNKSMAVSMNTFIGDDKEIYGHQPTFQTNYCESYNNTGKKEAGNKTMFNFKFDAYSSSSDEENEDHLNTNRLKQHMNDKNQINIGMNKYRKGVQRMF